MTIDELKEKYKRVPEELKKLKRWVCWNLELRDGKKTKTPINALSGKYAKSNDDITWSNFNLAISGCAKYNCAGIGFMLGGGVFGVDLDNHPNDDGSLPYPEEEFNSLAEEFITKLDSYTEKSQSGYGIHIICYGSLPKGRRRKGNVEMYDSYRFFAFTGNVMNAKPIENRENEIVPLWEKYVDDSKEIAEQQAKYQAQNNLYNPNNRYNFLNYDSDYKVEQKLADDDLIRKACDSKNGVEFASLYKGDMTSYGNDHSAADMAFCQMLAFWCNKDKQRMDRIFRTSGLMRPKWDQMRGTKTYGDITLDNALKRAVNGFINLVDNPSAKQKVISSGPSKIKFSTKVNADMNIDENGEPIFKIKKIFNKYSYDDTGNALRFYDYFGELFKYNKTDRIFMFWTGKTWIKDVKEIHRKYATKLIQILKEEIKNMQQETEDLKKEGEIEKAKNLEQVIDAAEKNAKRLANKAGKDAMISELESIKDIAVVTDEFDKDPYILNTDSGVVDLRTGDIHPFDSKYMLSKNTNIPVSFEEPTTWIKFLHSIFQRKDENEENEIIDCIQQCVGYTLSGLTDEQCMFICYGAGSNGKSTFSEQIAKILGDYGASTPSSTLIQPKNGQNSAAIYSIAKLKGARYVEMGETDEGDKLAEATIKRLTGGDTISAQFKYGNEFDFKPQFKIWMATNNKPVIRGTDLGIWRRMFPFPFLRTFTDKEKDRSLPGRLAAESDKILGWAIQGFLIYKQNGEIKMPSCLSSEIRKYKEQMDVISQFIKKQCNLIPNYKTPCRTLFQNYKMWGKDANEYVMGERKFEEELELRGIRQITYNGEPCYLGIKLNTDKTKAYVFNNFDEEEYYA